MLGLAGLLGSGGSLLARVIAGIDPVVNGEIRIKGRAVAIRKPGDAMAESVALVPEAHATEGYPRPFGRLQHAPRRHRPAVRRRVRRRRAPTSTLLRLCSRAPRIRTTP